MKLTEEQERVISSFGEGGNLIVNAFAGTGKTTTLLALAEAYPKTKILYLAYNRSIKEEVERKAKKRGLRNLQVKTFHGLAYQYKPKWVKEVKNIKPKEIIEILDLEEKFKDKTNTVATILYSALKGNERQAKNLAKATRVIEPQKIPELIRELHLKTSRDGYVDFEGLLYILREKLRSENRIKPKIVIIDEAQDVNNLQFDVAWLISERLVAVGDQHQAIYGWRGAENQLLKLQESKEFQIKRLYLTQSFRFPAGSQQEKYANVILKLLKREPKKVVGRYIPMQPPKTKAIISRRNTTLIEIALSIGSGYRFIRPVEEILSLPIDIYRYFYDYKPPKRHGWLSIFSDIRELEKYVEETEDIELSSALNFLRRYPDPETVLEKIKEGEGGENPIILTTAHSSKGLEFDEVELTDDFPDLVKMLIEKEKTVPQMLKLYREGVDISFVEEANLLYVAITRARERIAGIPSWLVEIENHNEKIFDLFIRTQIKKKKEQKEEV